MTEPLVASVMLDAEPDTSVARVALALTLYVHDVEPWEHGGALAACRALFEVCPPKNLRWFTTSRLDRWHCLSAEAVPDVVTHLEWAGATPRHCFGFWLADEPGAASCLFHYRAIDPRRSARAGVVTFALPQDSDPGLLWQLALAVGTRLPFSAGIGGYAASWNRLHSRTAFHEIRAWCRRYLGLDVQDPDRMAWAVGRAVPGTSWLTLVGPRLLDAWGETAASYAAHPWTSPEVLALPLARGGVLLRAGARPTLGDVHRLEYPTAYAEVARRLAARLPEAPPPMTGGFFVNEDTTEWMRRFVEPEGWR